MAGIAVLILLVVLFALVVKIGTVALRMTGLDEATASFQALSAYTGTGFTTSESEAIVEHPRRRRIIRVLMVLGNAGLASVVATLILSFSYLEAWQQASGAIALLGVALLILWRFAIGRSINRFLDRVIAGRLGGVGYLGMTELTELLSLARGFGVASVEIADHNPVAGRTLRELAWTQQGVLVLAIERSRALLATPAADTTIQAGDRLICYGKVASMREVAQPAPAEAHGEPQPPAP